MKRRKSRAKRIAKNLTNDLILASARVEKNEINILAVERALEINNHRIFQYFSGRSRWPATDWIKTLIILGQVHESRTQFEFYLPKTRELCRAFDKLYDQVKWRKTKDPKAIVAQDPDLLTEDDEELANL